MVRHFVRAAVIAALLVLWMFYPFFPGQYDGMAMALSMVIQLIGTVGLLLVPVGVLWLTYEVRKPAKRKENASQKDRGYSFAMISLITALPLVMAISLFAFLGVGISFGLPTLALWFYVGSRAISGLKRLRTTQAETINPIPFYLTFLPVALLFFQIMFAGPATEFSRNHAIANSNEFIRDIEAYHDEYGHYPVSLAAMWKDYYPDVVGVEKFHYSPFGDSYNLFFEQPRFVFDNIGTREWVVYNPNDEHRMFSHTAWFLLLTPEELERAQGWYAVHDASTPHWKYFWFD